MANREIKLGVIGTGQIGELHLASYQSIPGASVVAVADLNEAKARSVAATHDISHVFTDFRELLNMEEIDAVDVCLHNNLHAPVTLAALEAGKHVYCEKPMAGCYVDALAMSEAAQRLGRKLSIQLLSLFSPEVRAAHRLIEQGCLGRPYYARSCGIRRRGRPFVDGYGTKDFVRKATAAGGALFDMGVYHICTMLDLLDNPKVQTVTGATYQEIEMDPKRRDESQFDVEEHALGFVRLDGGVILEIEEAWAVHYDYSERSKLLGSRGGIKLHPLEYFSLVADMGMNATIDATEAEQRRQDLTEDPEAYDSPQHHWIAALQGRVPLKDTAGVALAAMLISDGIYLSSKLGREVTPEDVKAQCPSTAVDLGA